jgi:hypothetical protein
MTRQIGFSAAALIAAAITAGGCTQGPAPPQAKPKTSASKADDHNHTHDGDNHHEHGAGPHEGTLADWGGGTYHVEFTVDHDKKEALVYLLGADMKTPAPVKTGDGTLLLTIREPSFQVELSALPLPGETDGKASCYGGTHESLGIVREFAGTISGEVDGTPFAGDFAEEAHGDHDHK